MKYINGETAKDKENVRSIFNILDNLNNLNETDLKVIKQLGEKGYEDSLDSNRNIKENNDKKFTIYKKSSTK